MSPNDLSVIAMLWLTLSNLGFTIVDLDLTEPGFKQQHGPHTVYTFAVLLRDDMIFPKDEFCRLLDEYSRISNVKLHCYSVEEYPAHQCFYFNASERNRKSVTLKNFSHVYISVFL